MKRITPRIAVVLAGATLIVAGTAMGTAPAAASTDSGTTINGTQVQVPGLQTKADLDQFVASATPKTITLDPSTGKVLSVVAGAPVTPKISYRTACATTDAIWHTSQIPLAYACFYGSAGTYYGSWASRDYFNTGNYTASATWTYGGSSNRTPREGPPTTNSFGGTLVTGSSDTPSTRE
jgi:hypothetical protein